MTPLEFIVITMTVMYILYGGLELLALIRKAREES